MGGRTLYRLLCRDAGGETEGTLLTETVPTWVADIVVNRNLPKLIKVPFYLLPHPASGIKCVKKYGFTRLFFVEFTTLHFGPFLSLGIG